jgi:GPH family glycoside/pentoside/hexuronide:cation symporter
MAAYGSGTLPDSMVATATGTFLLFYLTAVCGLSNSLAGLALFVGLIVDAFADPIVGSVSDNAKFRLGRRHPFMLVSFAPMAIGLAMLFSVPRDLSGWGLFAYVTAVSIGLRICHSLFNLPYVALGAELSDDYAERTRIVASRFVFSVIGGAACLILATQVFMGGSDGLLRRAAYAPFGWTCAGVAVIGALVASLCTLGVLNRLHPSKSKAGSLAGRVISDVVEVARNRSFLALFGSILLMYTGAGAGGALLLHAYKFFWRLPAGVIQLVLLAGPAGALLGVIAGLAIIPRFEKRSVVIGGLCVYCAVLATPPLLRIAGLLPGDGLGVYAMLVAVAVLLSAVGTALLIAFQSALVDAADEHEYLFGTRREGLLFAGLNFSAKAAVGLGSLVAGLGLDLIHFPTDLAKQSGAGLRIDSTTARDLGLLYGPGPALLIALSIVIFLGYRLTRNGHAGIQAELLRRGEQEVPLTASGEKL